MDLNGNGLNGRAVTVFGGSRVAPGSREYEEAQRLGGLLAKKGFVVFNGGYGGVMEATHRGAKEAAGRTVGCSVELLSGRTVNQWVDEEYRSETLFRRLELLTGEADAYIALRGGVGTLLEVALVWNLAQLDPRARRPIIMVGDAWKNVTQALAAELYVRPEDLLQVTVVDTVEAAVDHVAALIA